MSQPTLSALTPNYNHAAYLPQAIAGVLGQSRLPDQYLIVDDASTDDSLALLESHAREHPVLQLVRNERNLGAGPTTEKLLALATGDYLYFGAADDYALPGFFAQAMDMAARYPEAAVICGQILVVDPEGRPQRTAEVQRWQEPLYASPEVFRRDYLDVEYAGHSLTCATLFRRDALLEVGGFRSELGHWADTFALRAMALKYGACYVPQPWAAYREMPASFGRSQLQNCQLTVELLHRAVALMRSPEFRERFPEDHVRDWQHRFQRMIFEDYSWQLRERFGRDRKGLWVGRAYKYYLLLKIALRYGGDFGAYFRREFGTG
jgi:glycosyltransferase involved in cell wall biosynthesis